MTDKEKLHQTLSSLWKNDDSIGKTYYNQALQDVQTAFDLLPEEPVSDVKTRVKEIFDSCEKIDVSDDEKNRVAFGLLALEGFAKIFYEMGKQQEEPVSEDLEKAADFYSNEHRIALMDYETGEVEMNKSLDVIEAFKTGAKWQHKQLEKNRLAACDRQTEEERKREQDFVDKIVIGEHLMPTYSDAIKYGIKWQKKQGVTKDVTIGMATEEILINVSQTILDTLDLCAGDKVIIQLRKYDYEETTKD